MNLIRTLGFVLCCAATGGAAEFNFTKRVDPGDLASKLEAAGFSVERVWNTGTATRVVLRPGEAKNPSAVVAAYVHPEDSRKAQIDELAAIERKLDDETATAADLRRAVKLMIQLNGLSRR